MPLLSSNALKNDTLQQRLLAHQKQNDPHQLHSMSMQELFDTTFTSKPALIEGFLHRGTFLFVGTPKLGKSYLALQLSYHISTGTPFWGFPVKQCEVLYLGIEDGYQRLQERLHRLFGVETTEKLRLAAGAKKLDDGLAEQIEGYMRKYPDTKLIVIDTLQKVRGSGKDGYNYGADYELMGKLKGLADRHGICLILVHHTRKMAANSSFDMISGTNGLFGGSDGAFVLYKKKADDSHAFLDITGRDVQEQRFKLGRDESTLAWNLLETEMEIYKEPIDPIIETVGTHFSENKSVWHGTATELVELLKLDIPPNKLTMKLNVNAGQLLQNYDIAYKSTRTSTGRSISFARVS